MGGAFIASNQGDPLHALCSESCFARWTVEMEEEEGERKKERIRALE